MLLGTWIAVSAIAGPLGYADRQLSHGHIDQAITEYKRFIFLNDASSGRTVAYAYAQLAKALHKQGQLAGEIEALKSAAQAEEDPIARDERRIAVAVAQMSQGHYDLAIFLLARLEAFGVTDEVRRRATFLSGICYIYAQRWAEAESTFGRMAVSATGSDRAIMQIVEEIRECRKSKLKSPRLAKGLSTAVPGLGQFYALNWREGLGALAVNSATTLLVGRDLATGQIKNAVFDFTSLFLRFYGGNRRAAAEAASKHNEMVSRMLVVRILALLEEPQ